MPNVEERLRSVQAERSQVLSRRTRAQVEEENAQRAIDEAKAALKSEYNVTTTDELKASRSKLEADLEGAVASAERHLAAAKGESSA